MDVTKPQCARRTISYIYLDTNRMSSVDMIYKRPENVINNTCSNLDVGLCQRNAHTHIHINTHTHTYIQECAILREGVPYVKLYRKTPKHLYPKLNSYGDNGHRKVEASVVSTHCKLPADSPNACQPFSKVLYYILNAYLQADKAVDFAAECAVSHLTSEGGVQCHV
jgi:hypothetical protein